MIISLVLKSLVSLYMIMVTHLGLDDQHNVPPPNQQFFKLMQGYRPPPTDEEIFVKLKKHGVEEFVGTTDHAVAEKWLRKFERIAERFNCTP